MVCTRPLSLPIPSFRRRRSPIKPSLLFRGRKGDRPEPTGPVPTDAVVRVHFDAKAPRLRAMGADQALAEATANVKRGAYEMKRALVRFRSTRMRESGAVGSATS